MVSRYVAGVGIADGVTILFFVVGSIPARFDCEQAQTTDQCRVCVALPSFVLKVLPLFLALWNVPGCRPTMASSHFSGRSRTTASKGSTHEIMTTEQGLG